MQTAPPPWRNLIYINILHNCDVRFRSCREPSASHSTFAHCSAAHSHIHQYDQLAEVLWIHYFAKCQPGVLLQAQASTLMAATDGHCRGAPTHWPICPSRKKPFHGHFGLRALYWFSRIYHAFKDRVYIFSLDFGSSGSCVLLPHNYRCTSS